MPAVSDVIAFLESIVPLELAETWDNVGLLVGRRHEPVNFVMTCLTLTPDVAAEAISKGVQLIVSHHPVLFRGAKSISDRDAAGAMLLSLIENRVSVYSPHTAFDNANEGINQQLAKAFQLKEIRPLRIDDMQSGVGSGRIGTLERPIGLKEFLGHVKIVAGADYIEFCGDLDERVLKVGVACGSAGEFLADAVQQGCDTFVTGETRFHTVLDARTNKTNLILLGHYASERPAVESLAQKIHDGVGVKAFASEFERDPLSIYTIS